MDLKEIVSGLTYVGGKNNERRTVVGRGSSDGYVVYGKTVERLPLGGFTRTFCIRRDSFARWATAHYIPQVKEV